MLTPTQEQWMGQIRQLLPILGTVLTAFGWAPDKVATWSSIILQIAGPAMIVGSIVWSFFANSRKSIMASAAANLGDAAPVEKAAVVNAVAEGLSKSTPAEKAAVVTAVAALPEVNKVELDRAQPGVIAINAATPANVTISQ